jgi:hypothetical protein
VVGPQIYPPMLPSADIQDDLFWETAVQHQTNTQTRSKTYALQLSLQCASRAAVMDGIIVLLIVTAHCCDLEAPHSICLFQPHITYQWHYDLTLAFLVAHDVETVACCLCVNVTVLTCI